MKDLELTLLEGVPHGSVRLTSKDGEVVSYRVPKIDCIAFKRLVS